MRNPASRAIAVMNSAISARSARLRPYRDHLLAAAVLAVVATSLPAQQQFVPLQPQLPANHDCVVQVAGDVDGDGDADLVCQQIYSYYHQPIASRLLLNDGDGSFSDAPAGSLPTTATGGLVLGDVDGDGDLDLVSVNYSWNPQSRNGLFLNDGQGNFTDVTTSNMPLDNFMGRNGTLADVDSDGDLDLLCTPYLTWGSPDQDRVYINDGNGVFTDETLARLPAAMDYTNDILAADFDGDGDLDLFCANSGQNCLYRNNGSGFFTDVTVSQLPQSNVGAGNAVAADFDGDGDLDIACGAANGGNRLFVNDGAGTFSDETASRLPIHFEITTFTAGDFDGDGDLDLLAVNTNICNPQPWGNCSGGQNRLYCNDGTGTFTDATARLPQAIDRTTGAIVGDLDGDGDLDIVAGNETVSFGPMSNEANTTTVLLNVQRQLDAPNPPQIGQPYSLDAYMRYGPSSTIDLAAIYLSTAPASVALQPFGTLGIDPALAVPFPTLVIPQPAGVGSAGFTIPNVPGLIGQVIYSQAMLVAYPANLRLSNVVRDVIAP